MENDNTTFVKEAGKAIVLNGLASAAATAGVLAGFVVVGSVINMFQKNKKTD